MTSEVLAHDVSVVLVGNFNPAIFSPAWLQTIGLISADDTALAEITVIHPQICEFTVSQFSIRVQPNTFTIATSEEPFVALADWVGFIFGKTLPHTPLRQAGINYSAHFAADNAEQRHELGRRLAPVEPWGNWGKSLEGKTLDEMGGLRSLEMMQSVVPDRPMGYRLVRLEPSVRNDVVAPSVGIYINVNDHYEATTPEESASAAYCVEWVCSNFDGSLKTAKSVITDIRQTVDKL